MGAKFSNTPQLAWTFLLPDPEGGDLADPIYALIEVKEYRAWHIIGAQ